MPAGWRIDPENPTIQRYWNGSRWTEATRDPVIHVEVRPSQIMPAIIGSILISSVIIFIALSMINAAGGF
ncbi:DUF2510 domain-containing protein [Rhodococcus marinonascens]|uniref:DUF2510 domain-containing protein n=1 Tax=Rhodococcus marinonascens TaxID=38311 RepID=UPI0009323B03